MSQEASRMPTDVRVTLPDGWDARGCAFGIDTRACAFREQLGLPTDRPIVMTGHQASIWHAGILAKYIAADEIARRFGGAQARLVVDQDDNDPFTLRVPVLNDAGITQSETTRLGPMMRPGVATGRAHAAGPPLPDKRRWALASVGEGVRRVHDALAMHADAESAAAQVAGALNTLMRPFAGVGVTVMATAMGRTDLFKEVLARMLDDPGAMAKAYNEAVAAIPEAGIKALMVPEDRVELPLWKIGDDGVRTGVWSDSVLSGDRLAPKALLMTGLMRLAGCEVFIHGTGGLVYDRIAEQWFGSWLGETLAPMIGVTADVFLPLPHADYTAATAAHAHWLAHSAPHQPALIGDRAYALRKSGLLEQIQAAPRGSAERKSRYLELHALLAEYRGARGGTLDEHSKSALRADALMVAGELARDRTWAFPLHGEAALMTLHDDVRSRLATGADAR